MRNRIIQLLILTCLCMMTGCNRNTVKLDKNGNTNETVTVQNVSFKNINLLYEDGITTLTADIINNKKSNLLVTINLKDNDNNIVQNVQQIIDSSNEKLMVGIVGDYSYIENIKIEAEELK